MMTFDDSSEPQTKRAKQNDPLEVTTDELPSPVLPPDAFTGTGRDFPPVEPPSKVEPTDINATLLSFMREATIPIFSVDGLPSPDKPTSFNDDLRLGSFRPSRYTWAGEQRKGIAMHIEASSIDDHLQKAIRADFFLSKEIPLPPEVIKSIGVIANSDPRALRAWWKLQLARVKGVVNCAADLQEIWNNSTPDYIKTSTGKLQTVALAFLLRTFDLGGGNWIKQFTFGFPIIGDLSQEGVYPRDTSCKPALPIQDIWLGSQERFALRAKSSGYLHSQALWDEALEQVKLGWLDAPVPIDTSGNVATFEKDRVNIAFRFGVDQADKLRACDDLKHNHVNLHCTVWTPIKLPTWDHISQMCLNIRTSERKWAFLKADHEAAYKQLPLEPSHANLALVALRNPVTSEWMAFPPKSLLFGAVAAVLHYNCFSRMVAVLFNLTFGIPLIGYFDDFGALIPYELSKDALDTFVEFCTTLGIHLKTRKTEVGWRIIFLGLQGTFPCPKNDMTLTIRLPPMKARTWKVMLERIINAGSVTHKELESVIGRLSFTQTSVFGRIGRAMLAPLYKKLHMEKYIPTLSMIEATSLRWWTVALDHMKPRKATPKPPITERIVYSDAAGKSQIIATVCLTPGTFASSKRLDTIRYSKTGNKWRKTFEKTCYIYGLEVLAILAILLEECNELRNKSVTFYIDNNNALCALVKNAANPPEIQAMVGLIWHRIRDLRITPWFERVPSKRNIADLPTRGMKVNYDTSWTGPFRNLRFLHKIVTKAINEVKRGLPIQRPILGNRPLRQNPITC